LKRLLKEKDLAVSSLAQPEQAKKIGRVLSVDGLVVGVISTHKLDHERTRAGRVTRLRNNATVVMTVKLIDTATGRVLYAREGVGNWWESGVEGSSRFVADELVLKKARDAAVFDSVKSMIMRWEKKQMTGYPSQIGIRIQDRDGSVVIRQVVRGGPAEKAGIKTGDVVRMIADKPVKVGCQVVMAVRQVPVGRTIEIEVERDGAPLRFVIKTAKAKAIPRAR